MVEATGYDQNIKELLRWLQKETKRLKKTIKTMHSDHTARTFC